MDSPRRAPKLLSGLLPGLLAHLDPVVHPARSGGARQACRGPFVLGDAGLAFDDRHAAVHANAEAVDGDLGPLEAAADGGLQFGVIRRSSLGGAGRCGRRRGDGRAALSPHQPRRQRQQAGCVWNGQTHSELSTLFSGRQRYNSHMSAHDLSRRQLFAGGFRAAAGFTAASYSKVLGANDRILLGVIGPGERGRHVMGLFQKDPRVQVTALCDIYAAQIDKALQLAPGAKTFRDHRALLEFKDLDVVLIATPDHWHAQTTIDALNAGKDVYVEKPLTLTIEEGPAIVKAARVNERVCQVGMQQRSGPHYLQAKREYFDTGRLGKVTLARTWWHGNTYHLRRAPDYLRQQPSNLDWARFLGPLKWRDWDPQQYWNWRAYLDFGGGQVTDLFTHWIDVVHMFLGQEIPISAVAAGGVYHYKDGRTAPDTINVLLEYPGEFTATFEATLAPGVRGAAIEICGTEGRLWISRERFEFHAAEKGAKPVVVEAEPYDFTLDHVKNFLECVRTRQRPNGDVLIGHRSAQASHLGNIAYVQKRRLAFDAVREEILPL